ncbi:hypothetical protein VPH35_077903 [Triticum aestivum]|uniref:Uncharacterized protein n=1 Tax=Aegilops tauschii subsp. strangulata TaxID=200361 RepID=A0A453HYS0_AEGTS
MNPIKHNERMNSVVGLGCLPTVEGILVPAWALHLILISQPSHLFVLPLFRFICCWGILVHFPLRYKLSSFSQIALPLAQPLALSPPARSLASRSISSPPPSPSRQCPPHRRLAPHRPDLYP